MALVRLQYPAYLTAHAASLSTTDRDRYEKQRVIVSQIVAAFEESGADYDPATETKESVSPEEAERRAERTERVVELVAKVSGVQGGYFAPSCFLFPGREGTDCEVN